jgi:hypothetical protein
MESLFEGKALIASLLDEFTHDIKGCGIACFEPFRVMQDKKLIFD